MKSWFPFTDYDFYAYLAAGFVVLFAVDYALNAGAIMLRNEWSVVQIILAVSVAYVVGQLLAAPSSVLLEHGVARGLLRAPSDILLALKPPRRREQFVQRWIIGRGYAPFPPYLVELIFERAAKTLRAPRGELTCAEDVFQIAYAAARRSPDTATRLDQLRTMYGFSRNIAFAGLVSGMVMLTSAAVTPRPYLTMLGLGALVVAVGMYARFLKFYAGFATEVFRTYAAEAELPGTT